MPLSYKAKPYTRGSLTLAFLSDIIKELPLHANGGGAFVPFYRVARGIQYTSPELNGFQAGGHIKIPGGNDKAKPGDVVCQYTDADGAAATTSTVEGTLASSNLACPAASTIVADLDSSVTGHQAADTVTRVEKIDPAAPGASQWALAATYKVRGFRVGGAYIVDPDAWHQPTVVTTAASGTRPEIKTESEGKREDTTTWFVSGKYGQDNWAVGAVYGQKNTSDNPNKTGTTGKWQEDQTYTSFSGNISVGKVGLAVSHDLSSNIDGDKTKDRTVTALSATYNLTSRSRVWVAYIANDDDNATSDSDDRSQDEITIGMRMDF